MNQYLINPSDIKIHILQGHTAFIPYKKLSPEHLIQKRLNPKLPTYQCITNPRTCTCPAHSFCVPLLAKRIQILLTQCSAFRYTRQILVPFKREEPKLLRRPPPIDFGAFHEAGTPTTQQLYKDTIHHNTAPIDRQPDSTHNGIASKAGEAGTQIGKLGTQIGKLGTQIGNKGKLGANNHKIGKLGANPYQMPESEKKLLLNLSAKDGGGEVVDGVRLTAKETMRRLLWQSGSQADEKLQVPRVWALWVPRGFENMVQPYRIFRCNYDGLKWLLGEAEIVYVTPPPAF